MPREGRPFSIYPPSSRSAYPKIRFIALRSFSTSGVLFIRLEQPSPKPAQKSLFARRNDAGVHRVLYCRPEFKRKAKKDIRRCIGIVGVNGSWRMT